MLSRLSHVDEVQYKRLNHYKVHEALKTRASGAILNLFPWSQVSPKEGGVVMGWGWVVETGRVKDGQF